MLNPEPSDTPLLKAVLEPLLEDFQYWFERSIQLLEAQPIRFLGPGDQADLLARVRAAQAEVRTAQTLLRLTDNQVGVETAVVRTWHQLLQECWRVGRRFRQEASAEEER